LNQKEHIKALFFLVSHSLLYFLFSWTLSLTGAIPRDPFAHFQLNDSDSSQEKGKKQRERKRNGKLWPSLWKKL